MRLYVYFRTPLHTDVFSSFSWSANICGRKRWLFFPPSEGNKLKDAHGNLIYDYTDLCERNKKDLYPLIADVKSPIEIFQNPGEIIFVPSGWYHQVFNEVKNKNSKNYHKIFIFVRILFKKIESTQGSSLSD